MHVTALWKSVASCCGVLASLSVTSAQSNVFDRDPLPNSSAGEVYVEFMQLCAKPGSPNATWLHPGLDISDTQEDSVWLPMSDGSDAWIAQVYDDSIYLIAADFQGNAYAMLIMMHLAIPEEVRSWWGRTVTAPFCVGTVDPGSGPNHLHVELHLSYGTHPIPENYQCWNPRLHAFTWAGDWTHDFDPPEIGWFEYDPVRSEVIVAARDIKRLCNDFVGGVQAITVEVNGDVAGDVWFDKLGVSVDETEAVYDCEVVSCIPPEEDWFFYSVPITGLITEDDVVRVLVEDVTAVVAYEIDPTVMPATPALTYSLNGSQLSIVCSASPPGLTGLFHVSYFYRGNTAGAKFMSSTSGERLEQDAWLIQVPVPPGTSVTRVHLTGLMENGDSVFLGSMRSDVSACLASQLRVTGSVSASSVCVHATLPAGERWQIAVFDVQGRQVRSLWAGPWRGGAALLSWDLTDSRRRPVQSGPYWVSGRGPGGVDRPSCRLVVVR